ncbi:TetR/AcrR family transcriptional regulator [Sphingomonas sp. PL-96]|uniref:TetR/AcrR family transcriptional regulator n=1 Tax=Sphingomonas sp. PL-96 TaxID=2887201 RepID=UPI001E39178A|nr:TetR/AcrR family transcriptional regulator [Sphingomonas sp. PL-96]MCC2978396.1 TetR/AcrR family transcriptional regulator [Sphingomonas sp. PL-96]
MTTQAADRQGRGARADARRRHLLDVARSLFVEQGFHQTGIAQIATASGIKVGQIYRDFESKEAIIAAICESDVTGWLEEDVLARAVAAKDLAAIRAWLTRFGSQAETAHDFRLMTEILAEAGRNSRVAEIYRTLDGRVHTSLSAALAALAPSAGAEEIEYLTELILTLGAGTACRRIVHGETSAKTVDCILDRVLNNEMDTLARAAGTSCTT